MIGFALFEQFEQFEPYFVNLEYWSRSDWPLHIILHIIFLRHVDSVGERG